METKELVNWLNEVIKYYKKGTIPWKRIKEIIKRLEERDEMKEGIHEMSQIVKILKKLGG